MRVAVRRALADLPPGALVLVACSGGADSLALADATAFEARRALWRAGLVTVDHGLQKGSALQAERVQSWGVAAGLDPVEICAVTVTAGSPGGPEAAARTARYAALAETCKRRGAAAVLLGHTRDDQAETVLLGLARGSGARSLAGMAAVRGPYRRPLLHLGRTVTRAACAEARLQPWDDPHNADRAYTRVAVRAVLRSLEQAAPGTTVGLARSADLLRADAEALDALADAARVEVTGPDGTLSCRGLAALAPAVRARVLHAAALAAGVPPGRLGQGHVAALDSLVMVWHGQGPTALPGGVLGLRTCGRLLLAVQPASGTLLANPPSR